ncbi:pentatricopeptide repeat-containing protein At1g12300, mitochondrial-like [Papaver somniferum]|nr:pentatricopeptide repeat-containing protein At1g12300, mitochondrial-like [Papaver somniferum]
MATEMMQSRFNASSATDTQGVLAERLQYSPDEYWSEDQSREGAVLAPQGGDSTETDSAGVSTETGSADGSAETEDAGPSNETEGAGVSAESENKQHEENVASRNDFVVEGDMGKGKRRNIPSSRLKGFVTHTIRENSLPHPHSTQSSSSGWRKAMEVEIRAFEEQGTWELQELPPGKRALGSKWIYTEKYDENGKLVRLKARLVIFGNHQVEGLDYKETFAPVAKMTTIRWFVRLGHSPVSWKTKKQPTVSRSSAEAEYRSMAAATFQVNYGFCLLGEIIKRGRQPNVITFTTLIKGLCIKRETDHAFNVFAKMTHSGIQPDAFTCNVLIQGICSTGKVALAIQLKNKMSKWKCRPDCVSYCAIIDTIYKGGLVDQAVILFSEMLNNSNVTPNVVPSNSLINGLCNSGMLSDAKRLLEEMVNRGISADVTTYTCMIHGHCLHGQWEEARRYFDEMMDRGILPIVVTFSILIDSHCKDGMAEEAWGLFELMDKINIKPNQFTYNSMIDGLCLAGQLQEAVKLFNSMVDKGLEPGVINCNILKYGYCKNHKLDEAMQLFQK